MQVRHLCTAAVAGLVAVTSIGHLNLAGAQDAEPEMLNPALTVRTLVSGLDLPIADRVS